MSRRQSRNRQRQLERELFGPEPTVVYRTRRRPKVAPEPPPQQKGDCAFYGSRYGTTTEPTEPWECPWCKEVYPP